MRATPSGPARLLPRTSLLRAAVDRKQASRALHVFLAIATLIALVWYLKTTVDYASESKQYDFVPLYLVSHNELRGPEMYDPEFLTTLLPTSIPQYSYFAGVGNGYLYPPLVVDLLRPIAVLSFASARQIWVSVNALCWLMVPVLLCFSVRPRPATPTLLATLLLAVAFLPSQTSIGQGQFDIVPMLVIVAASFFAGRRESPVAGVLVVASAIFKVYPLAFLFPYLSRRRFAVGATSALGGLAVIGLTSHGYESQTVLAYLGALRWTSSFIADSPNSVSIPSVLAHELVSWQYLGLLVVVAQLAVGSAVLFLLWQRRSTDWLLPDFALIASGSVLLPGLSWATRLVWLLLPIYCLLAGKQRSEYRSVAGRLLGIAIFFTGNGVILLQAAYPSLAVLSAGLLDILLVVSIPILASADHPAQTREVSTVD